MHFSGLSSMRDTVNVNAVLVRQQFRVLFNEHSIWHCCQNDFLDMIFQQCIHQCQLKWYARAWRRFRVTDAIMQYRVLTHTHTHTHNPHILLNKFISLCRISPPPPASPSLPNTAEVPQTHGLAVVRPPLAQPPNWDTLGGGGRSLSLFPPRLESPKHVGISLSLSLSVHVL